MFAVPVETQPSFTIGNAYLLFEGLYRNIGGWRTYDLTPDGERFAMVGLASLTDGEAPAELMLVQNWHEELKRLVPVD